MKTASPLKHLSPKERIILPLDFDSLSEAKKAIEELKDYVGLFKVGLTLYIKEGKSVIKYLAKEVGKDKVFFDLKFNDIPETISSVSSVVVAMGDTIKFITVHASEGERVLRAAVNQLRNGTKILGITVLTSMTDAELKELGFNITVKERVLKLAEFSQKAGCAGVVCSGLEAREVKKQCGDEFIVVTPGIRPKWSNISGDDQRRIMTPKDATINGSDYIVVGRPILTAKDRVDAAKKIADEIEQALHQVISV